MTWSDVLHQCPFRTLIGTQGGPLQHTFAAIGGEVVPIADNVVRDMVGTVQGGGLVLILADRADLRDAAKAQLTQAITLAAMPEAGRA